MASKFSALSKTQREKNISAADFKRGATEDDPERKLPGGTHESETRPWEIPGLDIDKLGGRQTLYVRAPATLKMKMDFLVEKGIGSSLNELAVLLLTAGVDRELKELDKNRF
jgi:hypothetical protein